MAAIDPLATADFDAELQGPRDAQLWLNSTEQEAWITGNKTSPFAAFASIVGFWILHVISPRFFNRKKTVKSKRGVAELQHAFGALLNSLAAVSAGFFLIIYRDLSLVCRPGAAFCFDQPSSLLLDFHVGFLFYELLFYHNHSKLLRPQYGMTLLHHMIFIVGFGLSKLYPCRLSLELLPYYQLLGVAGVFDSLRMILNVYGAPAQTHLANLVAMCGAFLARTVASGMLAVKTYAWIKAHDLWALQLPAGQSVYSRPYGIFFIAGSWVVTMIYAKWLLEGIGMVDKLKEAAARQQGRGEGRQQQHAGNGKAKNGKDKKRR